ncbi:LacI family transcriptional regulator [Granulosicoccus antarcticus]|uniref:HTH-type transcriptional regulator RafR n=1 Tax=Granulosicoccus antarcticus IMCC3135 TaxID=1192854 RepID=A0A2Z2NVQ1_9GAMM|nr:LacI family transcriptional regulator [Granulosicoccus antarcticus]ASJ73808.1 HTH-type transcriptional regulator RafR [Granulosicoccus antarcticus IMCC3135]
MSQQDNNPDQASHNLVRPTLKTISQLSGFAVPTVSRALSDAPDIGAETKKTVCRIADEIGYVPNRAGLRLRTGRTNVISLVLPIENDVMNHTAQLIEGIASELRNTAYHLNVTPWFSGEDPMKPVRYIVETKSADALILNATTPQDPRVKYLMERNFPFATHGRTDWSSDHPYFDFDNTAFAYGGLKKLAMRGRSRIFAILPPKDQFYSQCMAQGLKHASDETGVSVRICDKIRSDSPAETVRDRILEVLQKDPSIDGIFVGSTVASLAAIDAVDTFELSFPDQARQIDVFGKESIPFRSLFRKELLSMHEDVRRAGRFLAEAVLQSIKYPDKPPLQELEKPLEVLP